MHSTELQKIEDFNRQRVYIGKSSKGYGFTYFTKKDIKKGRVVMKGGGRLTDHQTAHCSVQIGLGKHYVPSKWTGRYWNHSCEPNTYVQTDRRGLPALIALRDIKKDEEITFAYWMTELGWAKHANEVKIKCKCGTKTCRGKILSFNDLPEKEKKILKKRGHVSRYLLNK